LLRRLNFDLWYLFRPPWDSRVSPPELLGFLETHSAGRAIDIGCGSGTNIITLARRGWHVTGIDFAPRAIRIARRRLQQEKVSATLIVGDVTHTTGVAGPFDLALDLGCFHGIDDRQAYLHNLDRLLGASSYWLLYAFFKRASSESGSGLDPSALELIDAHGYNLLSRTDGTDKWGRPSAWLLYQSSAKPSSF
jgi:SAM-dependent methyltransferase